MRGHAGRDWAESHGVGWRNRTETTVVWRNREESGGIGRSLVISKGNELVSCWSRIEICKCLRIGVGRCQKGLGETGRSLDESGGIIRNRVDSNENELARVGSDRTERSPLNQMESNGTIHPAPHPSHFPLPPPFPPHTPFLPSHRCTMHYHTMFFVPRTLFLFFLSTTRLLFLFIPIQTSRYYVATEDNECLTRASIQKIKKWDVWKYLPQKR